MRPLFLLLVLPALLGSARAVEFEKASASGKQITVCRVHLKTERLQLFLRDDSGRPLNTFANLEKLVASRGQRLAFAMNAGMYHPDYAPVGLFVSEGREVTPLNTADAEGNFFLKPNGVFLLTSSGARVLESSEVRGVQEKIQLATQSGPLLVRGNVIHPKFKADSTSRLLRNGVGIPSPDFALFAISEEPLNLYEFAAFFRDVLKCPDALYFDGTVSSLHAPALKRSDAKINLGPLIGVVETPP